MRKRFSKRKLQVVNTKTNRPIHPQPTSSKTYNPYAVLFPFTSVFLLELTVHTCRKKERPPTTLVAILNLRARSRGPALTNQTFFASEMSQVPKVSRMRDISSNHTPLNQVRGKQVSMSSHQEANTTHVPP